MRTIIFARKPLVVQNILQSTVLEGTGALNIDMSRVPVEDGTNPSISRRASAAKSGFAGRVGRMKPDYDSNLLGKFHEGSKKPEVSLAIYTEERAGEMLGRYPSNVIFSDREAMDDLDQQGVGIGAHSSGCTKITDKPKNTGPTGVVGFGHGNNDRRYGDSEMNGVSVSRFYKLFITE